MQLLILIFPAEAISVSEVDKCTGHPIDHITEDNDEWWIKPNFHFIEAVQEIFGTVLAAQGRYYNYGTVFYPTEA
jgi:hypothetical protein